MFRKKKYKVKFWCSNCGCDFKMKLPFGVMPTLHKKFYHLYDIGQQSMVDLKGNKIKTAFHINCKKCGSFEVNHYNWRVTLKNKGEK